MNILCHSASSILPCRISNNTRSMYVKHHIMIYHSFNQCSMMGHERSYSRVCLHGIWTRDRLGKAIVIKRREPHLNWFGVGSLSKLLGVDNTWWKDNEWSDLYTCSLFSKSLKSNLYSVFHIVPLCKMLPVLIHLLAIIAR